MITYIKLLIKLVKEVSIFEFSTNALAAVGLIWGLIEVSSYFFSENFDSVVKPYWWVVLLISLLYSAYKSWPKKTYVFPIPNRDTRIHLFLGDSFNVNGCLIIPINNNLEVNPRGRIGSSNSILSQFVKKYYDSKPRILQDEIHIALEDKFYESYREIDGSFKIGTVIPITTHNKQFCLLVSAKLGNHNRSNTTKETLELSLNELWTYLPNHAGKDTFIIPVIGTGRGRINMNREAVIKEIVLSFLASCADQNYADKLVICITPNDFVTHDINIGHLLKWMDAKIKFAEFQNSMPTKGTNLLNV